MSLPIIPFESKVTHVGHGLITTFPIYKSILYLKVVSGCYS